VTRATNTYRVLTIRPTGRKSLARGVREHKTVSNAIEVSERKYRSHRRRIRRNFNRSTSPKRTVRVAFARLPFTVSFVIRFAIASRQPVGIHGRFYARAVLVCLLPERCSYINARSSARLHYRVPTWEVNESWRRTHSVPR